VNQERRHEVRERTRDVLESLSTPERKLLTQILRIEHENVHLKKPRVKEDMLRAVRETIK
jgi:hypothetical protein